MSDFHRYFKENMEALGLPAPDSLFGTLQSSLTTVTVLLASIDKFGKTATIADLIGAGTRLEKLGMIGTLSAAFYAGACIRSLAVATGTSMSGGATVADVLLYARMHQSMESLEVTDHVSRLLTLQYGQHRTLEEFARCEAAGLAFAGLLVGIDDFKGYNDRCGQDLGDRSLAEIGEMVKSSLRGGDIAFRYGGRLIAVALPGASSEQAALIAEGIRDRVQQHRFPGPGGQRDQAITLSIGLAAWAAGTRPVESADIFKVVLGRLHRAESDGGNRVYASSG